jgi:hypothetical protein
MDRGKCKACGEPILILYWALSQHPLALDATPSDKGAIAIVNGMAFFLEGHELEGILSGDRYTNHVVTCKRTLKRRGE